MKKFFFRIWIKIIRYLRDNDWLKQPKRTYTYKGLKLSFYKAPPHGTSEGKLFMKKSEIFNSVKFWKTLDQIKSLNI